jgi:hypothetical protein
VLVFSTFFASTMALPCGVLSEGELKSRDSKTLIGDSVDEQIAWIQARFSNQTPERQLQLKRWAR